MDDIGQGAEERGDYDQGTGIADRQVDGQLQKKNHEGDGHYTATDAEEGGKCATGDTHQQKRRSGRLPLALRGKAWMKEEKFQGDYDLHQTEQALEPSSGQLGRQRCSGHGSCNSSEGQEADLMPFDVSPFTMSQSAAEGGGYNDGQTGTESGVDDNLGHETCDLECPEEKRNQNDPAAYAQQPCQKAGQGAEQNQKKNDMGGKWLHGE